MEAKPNILHTQHSSANTEKSISIASEQLSHTGVIKRRFDFYCSDSGVAHRESAGNFDTVTPVRESNGTCVCTAETRIPLGPNNRIPFVHLNTPA